MNKDGYPVLKEGAGADPQARFVQISKPNVTVAFNGEIFEGPNSIGKLSLVEVSNLDALQKVGQSSYKIKNNMSIDSSPAKESQVHQGFMETSNVNVVKEMTDMITATRGFEANQQAIKAADRINEKLVNVVAKQG